MGEKTIEYLLMNGFKILELVDEERFFVFYSIEYPQKTNITFVPFTQIQGFEITNSFKNAESNFPDLVAKLLERKKLRFNISENIKFITYEKT